MGNNTPAKGLFWGMLFFLMSTFLASFGPPTFKYVVLKFGMSENNVVFYFLFFGGLSLLPSLIKDIKKEGTQVSKLFSKNIIGYLILSGFLYPMTYVCYTEALMRKSVTETVPLIRLDALFAVIIASVFLGQQVKSWTKLITAMLICMTGLFVFLEISLAKFATEIFDRYIGLILLIAFFLAMNEAVKRKIQKKGIASDMTIVCLTLLIGSIALSIYLMLIGHPIVQSNWEQFPYLLFLGTATIGLSGWLNLKAYDAAQNLSKIYLLTFFRPAFALIIAFFLLGEKNFNYVNMLIGFGLILLGVYIAKKQLVSEKP